MPVTVSEIKDDEMLRAFTVTSLAFEHNEPLWDVMYPFHWTDAGRQEAAKRWIAKNRTDPHAIFAKAVDNATGTIMGTGHWLLYHPSIQEPNHEIEGDDPGYTDPGEQAYAKAMMDAFSEPRDSVVKSSGGKCIDLEALAVDPEWQKKGAGDALVAWGCRKADELGLDACVGATVCGRRVYEKNGYVKERHVILLEKDEKWGDRPKQTFDWMIRERRT